MILQNATRIALSLCFIFGTTSVLADTPKVPQDVYLKMIRAGEVTGQSYIRKFIIKHPTFEYASEDAKEFVVQRANQILEVAARTAMDRVALQYLTEKVVREPDFFVEDVLHNRDIDYRGYKKEFIDAAILASEEAYT